MSRPLLHSSYIGRFAPSPSGPLHLGSLVSALASYLDAKQHSGKWLVRIEDIDPPREQAGADQLILQCLQAHGLEWDGEVRYQSQQSSRYRDRLDTLSKADLSYYCSCTRARLKTLNHVYDGHCRGQKIPPSDPTAIRLNTEHAKRIANGWESFEDLIQGSQPDDSLQRGDFIIHRKDGLFAYNMAVVSDDIDQMVTHIVRGIDLLDTTNQQRLLHQQFTQTEIVYAHIPVIVDEQQRKLSKQNHAPALINENAETNLHKACKALQLDIPRHIKRVNDILQWSIEAWNPNKLQDLKTINLSALD